MENFNILKKNIECYSLRKKNGTGGFADIAIDCGDKSGRIFISSDYGNWTYYWSSCGIDFKTFLCKLEISYLADRFDADNHFDSESTISRLKQLILDRRYEEYFSKEQARNFWNLTIQLSDCDSARKFIDQYISSGLEELETIGYVDIITTISPQFKRFWDTTWQAFVQQLKNEKRLQDYFRSRSWSSQ